MLARSPQAAGLYDSSIKFMLAGHYHLFEYIEYDSRAPVRAPVSIQRLVSRS